LPLDCRAQHTVGEIIVQFRPVTNSAIASHCLLRPKDMHAGHGPYIVSTDR
jgi:hypothetical protein